LLFVTRQMLDFIACARLPVNPDYAKQIHVVAMYLTPACSVTPR